MIKWTGLLLSVFLCIQAISQKTTGAGKLSGTLRDSLSGQPLEKATIRLYTTGSSKWKIETVTGRDGYFSIPGIPAGNYTLSAEFIGYNSFSKNDIFFAGDGGDRILDIYLLTNVKSLQSVVVTGSRSLVENKIDRL